ncbi:hypothetical protein ACIQZG_22560 [Lysinibacillus sp. NPDC096418]|uniref:hypothetical protein n=1 Tax=Lysinibacillus sp. NPDC096418 TaxID=3364138 RepID=UPI00382F2D22
MKRKSITNEEKARKILVNMMTGFRKVRNKEQMLNNVGWYDFASGIHNLELTKKIMESEIDNVFIFEID